MRTTLELPDGLLKRAKIDAVRRGITLKELVARGIERELEEGDGASERRRAAFPIFRPTQPGVRPITPEDVRREELEEDVRLSAREQLPCTCSM